MVTRLTKTMYHCPYCSAKFDESGDCSDHIVDGHEESPVEKQVTKYGCDICKHEYDTRNEAVTCEDKHTDEEQEDYESRMKLEMARHHPHQKDLFRFNPELRREIEELRKKSEGCKNEDKSIVSDAGERSV